MQLLMRVMSVFEGGERRRAGALVAALVLAAVLESIGVGLVLPFVALVADAGLVERSAPLGVVREALGTPDHGPFVVLCGLLLLAFYVVKNVLLGSLAYARHRFVFGKMERMSARLLGAYLTAPYAFHVRRNSADLQRNVNANVPLAFDWVVAHTFILVSDVLVVVVMGALLAFLAPVATVAAVGGLAALAAVYVRIVRTRTRELGREEQRAFGGMVRCVNESLGALKETRIRGVEGFFLARHARECARYVRARRLLETASDAPRLLLETVAVGGVVGVMAIAILRGAEMREVLPLVALFAAASFRLLPAFTRIIRSLHLVRHYRPAFDAALDDLDVLGRVPAALTAAPDSRRPREPLRSGLELRDVHFRYDGEREPALRGVSVTIGRGSSVALVGPTGSGKTTVVDLLLGLFEPTSGAVLADGADVRADLATWRSRCGYVPQEVFLTDDTIRRNVAFGVPDEAIDDAAVERALRAARLHELVLGLPRGLDHEIGERGVRLSGGERQRLGIARALYHEPEVLVLDEALSALDADTESEVAATTLDLAGDRTVIVIAHRMSTVERCDRLVFLRDGEVEAEGRFDDLARTSPEFRRMARLS